MKRTSKRSFAVLGGAIFLTGATGCLTLPTENSPAAESPDDETRCMGRCGPTGDITGLDDFEFIIVGSGAGGGPLAANLSRNHKVLLLEAGGDPGSERANLSTRLHYQIPSYHRESTEDPSMRWDYLVDHYSDQELARRDTKYCGSGATGAFCDSITDRGPSGPTGVFYPRSSALGGCTAHNAMISIAPQDSDWQNIVEITGDTTWAPAAMRGLFAEVERNHYLDASKPDSDPIWQGHGRNGWLSIEFPDSRLALGDPKILVAVQGAQQAFTQVHGGNAIDSLEGLLGLMNRDLNTAGPLSENLYTIPLAVDDSTGKHMRNGTREVLIEAINRPDTKLTIRLHSLVTKVVFADEVGGADPQRAVGVDFLDGVRLYHADRTMSLKPSAPTNETRRVLVGNPGEVILSAGAFNTPQLLMQSGIGPREHLEAVHAVDDTHPMRVDLPGVGGNLQDRYEVGVIGTFTGYATPWPHYILDGHIDGARETEGMLDILGKCTFGNDPDTNHPGRSPDPNDPCLLQWQQGEGPYGSNGAVTAILHRSGTAATPDPDLVIFGLPGEFHGYHLDYSGQLVRNQFTWAILKSHTQNSVVTSHTDAQGNVVRDLSGTGGGTVRLRPNPNDPSLPPDPRVPPAINFHSFQEGRNDQQQGDRDLEAVVDGTLIALQIGVDMDRKMRPLGLTNGHYQTVWPSSDVLMPPTGAAAFQKVLNKNNKWFVQCSGRAEARPSGCVEMRNRLREWVRRESWGHHASCTAPIGIADVNNDPELQTNPGNAVLDSHFRVRGTRGLRVVDASVFPQIPGEFVVMPVYMISQKAYHTIEADWSTQAVDPGPQPEPGDDEQLPDPPATCGDSGAYCSEPGECCSGECDVDWNECI